MHTPFSCRTNDYPDYNDLIRNSGNFSVNSQGTVFQEASDSATSLKKIDSVRFGLEMKTARKEKRKDRKEYRMTGNVKSIFFYRGDESQKGVYFQIPLISLPHVLQRPDAIHGRSVL